MVLTTSISRKQTLPESIVLELKDRLYLFRKRLRWLRSSVRNLDVPAQRWVVRSWGLRAREDWYTSLQAIEIMIKQLGYFLETYERKYSVSLANQIITLTDDVDQNLSRLQRWVLDRMPAQQRGVERYFLQTMQETQKQHKKRRLTSGIHI